MCRARASLHAPARRSVQTQRARPSGIQSRSRRNALLHGHTYPQDLIWRRQFRPPHGTMQNAELMPKREVLKLECGSASGDTSKAANEGHLKTGQWKQAGRVLYTRLWALKARKKSACSG
jgi:hypothetical protein